jgi:hypothetical protein
VYWQTEFFKETVEAGPDVVGTVIAVADERESARAAGASP